MNEPSTAIERSIIDASYIGDRSANTHTVEIDGEAVVLDEASDRLHLLNRTATLVWHCLDGTSSIGAICEDLSRELGAQFDTVLVETLEVLRNLSEEGLIRFATPPCEATC